MIVIGMICFLIKLLFNWSFLYSVGTDLRILIMLYCVDDFMMCNVLSERERGAWSVICETEEQWVNLAESIKDKISPQDRHLHRIITQNFLPEISNMIEHKVRLFTLSCDIMMHELNKDIDHNLNVD